MFSLSLGCSYPQLKKHDCNAFDEMLQYMYKREPCNTTLEIFLQFESHLLVKILSIIPIFWPNFVLQVIIQ